MTATEAGKKAKFLEILSDNYLKLSEKAIKEHDDLDTGEILFRTSLAVIVEAAFYRTIEEGLTQGSIKAYDDTEEKIYFEEDDDG